MVTTFPTWNMEFSGHPTWKYRYNIFCIICEIVHVAVAANSLQSCLTLCDPIDGSPPGSFVPGILQARTLEWVAISFSNAWKWKLKVKSLSYVRLITTSWTAAYQAPPSVGFSRQEYWSGVPLPSPRHVYFPPAFCTDEASLSCWEKGFIPPSWWPPAASPREGWLGALCKHITLSGFSHPDTDCVHLPSCTHFCII